jgi:hypothetical protein
MGGIGLQRELRKRFHDGSGGQQFVKVARLVCFKPNRHERFVESKVFELCVKGASLGRKALGAVPAKFHENAGAATFAADAVALSVERFEASTGGAFVVNEFNHILLSGLCHRSPRFQSVP